MARPRSDEKRMSRISTPASARELKEFKVACALVRMEPADTLRKLASAFVEHVDKHRFVVQPIVLAGPPNAKR